MMSDAGLGRPDVDPVGVRLVWELEVELVAEVALGLKVEIVNGLESRLSSLHHNNRRPSGREWDITFGISSKSLMLM